MKIAIISDTHDNLVNLNKALQYIRGEKIGTIIHLGDMVSQETLDYLIESFEGKLFITRGNADLYDVIPVKTGIQDADNGSPTRLTARQVSSFTRLEDDKERIQFFNEYAEIKIDKRIIGIVHKRNDIPYQVTSYKLQVTNQIPDTICYGHTHKPWIEEIKGIIYANPGNLAGIHYDLTFAVYETSNNTLELKILNQI